MRTESTLVNSFSTIISDLGTQGPAKVAQSETAIVRVVRTLEMRADMGIQKSDGRISPTAGWIQADQYPETCTRRVCNVS